MSILFLKHGLHFVLDGKRKAEEFLPGRKKMPLSHNKTLILFRNLQSSILFWLLEREQVNQSSNNCQALELGDIGFKH